MLSIVYLPLDEVHPYDKNPRKNDIAVDKVAESIQEFGWQVPIVIDKNHVIIAGHTRYKAAQKLGIDKVPCVIAEGLSEKQVKAYRLADNKVSDYSLWDNKLLLEELLDIDNEVFTGFEIGETFDVLDESSSKLDMDAEDGSIYELVIRSENKEKLEKLQEIWEGMANESAEDSGR